MASTMGIGHQRTLDFSQNSLQLGTAAGETERHERIRCLVSSMVHEKNETAVFGIDHCLISPDLNHPFRHHPALSAGSTRSLVHHRQERRLLWSMMSHRLPERLRCRRGRPAALCVREGMRHPRMPEAFGGLQAATPRLFDGAAGYRQFLERWRSHEFRRGLVHTQAIWSTN